MCHPTEKSKTLPEMSRDLDCAEMVGVTLSLLRAHITVLHGQIEAQEETIERLKRGRDEPSRGGEAASKRSKR